MHPHLGLHAHPRCQKQILALQDCHRTHSVLKFLGKCNEVRRQLDACLYEEYVEARTANMNKRNEERDRMLASMNKA